MVGAKGPKSRKDENASQPSRLRSRRLGGALDPSGGVERPCTQGRRTSGAASDEGVEHIALREGLSAKRQGAAHQQVHGVEGLAHEIRTLRKRAVQPSDGGVIAALL